ncbi:MAG: LytTR family transcriptional regulator, partial [Firmicutes bacterium]|nr:LytTR family transcriptional regulator [Bacillota bacterium]
DKLDGLQQRVDGRFFRCHRSFLVNLDYVRSCEGGLVRLEGGSEIPLSRLREQEFREALLAHMKERRR